MQIACNYSLSWPFRLCVMIGLQYGLQGVGCQNGGNYSNPYDCRSDDLLFPILDCLLCLIDPHFYNHLLLLTSETLSLRRVLSFVCSDSFR